MNKRGQDTTRIGGGRDEGVGRERKGRLWDV